MPAHGRLVKTALCLRALRSVCGKLTEDGLDASCIVVADDENLALAEEVGFTTLERDNSPLGRKWNDGYEEAARQGATYFVPIGSDDWVDPQIFGRLPSGREVICFRQLAIMRPDGAEMSMLEIPYQAGIGIRIFHRSLLECVGFRPCNDAKERAIDTSVVAKLMRRLPPKWRYADVHPLQIVDFKESTQQLNTYEACLPYRVTQTVFPFKLLMSVYPQSLVRDMWEVYTGVPA